MYQLWLYVHIVCAAIWVGGAFYVQLLAIRVERSSDPEDLPRLGRHIESLGNLVFAPAALLLLVSGAFMANQAFGFGQTWIVAAIVLWALSAVAGAVYVAPRAKQAIRLFEQEGPTSPAARRMLGRLFLVSRLELLSFAAALALMAFKPTV
jgi:uncharacterized membrane protein